MDRPSLLDQWREHDRQLAELIAIREAEPDAADIEQLRRLDAPRNLALLMVAIVIVAVEAVFVAAVLP
jgi:hypothetical protein